MTSGRAGGRAAGLARGLGGRLALALAVVVPLAFAVVSGQAGEGLSGPAGWASAAGSVSCTPGFTGFTALLLAELALGLALVLAAQWRGRSAAGGWYLLALGVLLAMPFLLAWQTGSSACVRGKAFFWESIFVDVFILAVLAISYNLLFGFTGVVSFGHAAFFGTGAYGVGLLMEHLGWPWWLAIAGTLLAGALIALVMGVVGVRIKGLYFALFTLALAEILFLLARNRILVNITGAEDGFSFAVPDWLNATKNRLFFYYLALAVLVAAFLFVQRLMHSPTGRVLAALRDNEGRAQMLGYNTFVFKLIAIVLSGLLATAAGVLRGLALKGASPEVLSLDYTITPLLMTIIGGVGSFLGPVLGAFGLQLTEQALRDSVLVLGGLRFNIGEHWALLLGLLFILSVMVFPQGVVGTLRAVRRGS